MSEISDFVSEALAKKDNDVLAPVNTVQLGQFHDDDYWYLLQPIGWEPNADVPLQYKAVTVPSGFVTDLTSIPRVFFQLLSRTGVYLHAAIVHDYLYWTQTTTRKMADEIFNFAMIDLKVKTVARVAIYQAVDKLGGRAWKSNAKMKATGQQRVLQEFPTNPMISWSQWKNKNPSPFDSN